MLKSGMWEPQNASLPIQIFQLYEKLEERFTNRNNWLQMTEEEMWSELCLCILASNVPYELAQSSMLYLKNTGKLDKQWILRNPNARQIIAVELSKPMFLPRRRDGSYRKYRFPKVRARDIVGAARVLYHQNEGIQKLMRRSQSHEELRNTLANEVPGLGLKESSHFLRNVGYASDLAIIDVHIISFLREIGLLPNSRLTLTAKTYFQIEDIMQQIARTYDLDLAILDNAIWRYMRSKFGEYSI